MAGHFLVVVKPFVATVLANDFATPVWGQMAFEVGLSSYPWLEVEIMIVIVKVTGSALTSE